MHDTIMANLLMLSDAAAKAAEGMKSALLQSSVERQLLMQKRQERRQEPSADSQSN